MAAPPDAAKAAQAAVQRRADVLQARITREYLERVLRAQQPDSRRELLERIQRTYGEQRDLRDALRRAQQTGIDEGHRSIRFPPEAALVRDLSRADTQTAQWAFDRASEQWTLLSSLIAQGVRPGYTVRDVSSLLHDVLGLSPRYANAVLRFRDGLTGTLPAWEANHAARRYAQRLQRSRARMTAVTQVNVARNTGVELTWRTAVSLGLLPASTQRVWVVTEDERLCVRCMALDGLRVALDQPWETASGPVYTPGTLHPSCRCEERLALS